MQKLTEEEKRLRKNENRKRWVTKNKDKVKEYVKKYQAANPDYYKEASRKYREKMKANKPEKIKKHPFKNKREYLEYLKINDIEKYNTLSNSNKNSYYFKNRDKILAKSKEKRSLKYI